jgi:hypothetical protein
MMATPDTPTDKAAAAKPAQPSFLSMREGIPTGEMVTLTPEQARARRRRGHWIALALFTFVILIFVITMTKLGANVLVRDL